MDSPGNQQVEDKEVAAAAALASAQPAEPWTSLRDLPELEPEEIEKRLAKTRQGLSNRRKILIKNLPPDTTNQVEHFFQVDSRRSQSRAARFKLDLRILCASMGRA